MAGDSAGLPAADEPTTPAAADGTTPADGRPAPAIEVLGGATPEQVAALVSVLSAAGGTEEEPPRRRRSDWAAYEAVIRRPLHPGPGAWRSSLRHS